MKPVSPVVYALAICALAACTRQAAAPAAAPVAEAPVQVSERPASPPPEDLEFTFGDPRPAPKAKSATPEPAAPMRANEATPTGKSGLIHSAR